MPASLHILMREILDYAGLFPPAKLPMADAVTEYLDHRAEESSSMLARFVCPAARLAEMVQYVPAAANPIRIAVLGHGGADADVLMDGIESDLDLVSAVDGSVVADQYEVRLPAAADPGPAAGVLGRGPRPMMPYFEVPLLGTWRDRLLDTVSALAAAPSPAGLKIRCGGLEASAFPSAHAVATAIAACRDAGIPLKATQGLHHPIRHRDAHLGVEMHGFLNLFVAAVLAHAHGLAADDLLPVVEERNGAAFRFSDHSLVWRDLEVDLEDIETARRELVAGFGSCSFAEPRDDLAKLGFDRPAS